MTLLIWSISLVACGGEAASGVDIEEAENAEINKSIQADSWEVTLIETPLKTKEVGSGTNQRGGEWGDVGVKIAEGVWIIVPVRLVNNADEMRMVSKDLFAVVDGQGRTFNTADRRVHSSYIWNNERWGDRDNQLPANPQDKAETREGPLIFDVPEDATDLKLKIEGLDESISLGF